MKKLLYSVATLALAFFAASCQSENLEPVAGSNTVTYTVQVPGACATKALGDEIADVDVLIYEVYRTDVKNDVTFTDADNLLYHKTAKVNNGVANITLELVNNQNFTVLFWAQSEVEGEGVYNVGDLTNVTIATSSACNLESTQAFSGVDFIEKGESLAGRTVTLTRPVSQLNIATTKASLTAFNDKVLLNGSSVTVKGLSQSFNVATQAAGDVTEAVYTYSETAVPAEELDATYQYVAMNYVGFAPVLGTNAVVTYKINTSEGEIDNTIASVPMKPNYRTNIIGNLITSTSDYTITLEDEWDGTENVEIWDGSSEEVIPDATTGEYQIATIEQLAWVAEQASTVGFKNKTISFIADLDFHGSSWTPIALLGEGGQPVHIKGNGHKIANFKIDAGKPAAIFSNLVGNIDDLHVENAVVNGAGQAGTLVGKMYGNVTNCSAKNVKVTAKSDAKIDGRFVEADKVGALVGQIQEGSFKVENCSVENAVLYGWREIGSILGYSNSDLSSFVNNSAKNVTIIVDEWYHVPYEVGKTQRVGTFVGTHSAYTGVEENVKFAYEKADGLVEYDTYFEVSKPAGFAWFAGKQLPKDVRLMADIDMNGVEMQALRPKNGKVFEGNNHTISNVEFTKANDGSSLPGWNAMFAYAPGNGVTVRNLTLDNIRIADGNYSGGVLAYCEGTNVLENVTVKNSYIAGQNKVGGLVGYMTSSGTLTANNCHVIRSTVTTDVNGGEGQCGGLIGYVQGNTELTDCSVQNTSIKSHMTESSKTFGKYIGIFHGGNSAVLTVVNASVDNLTTVTGLDATAQAYVSPYGEFLGGWRVAGGAVTINGVPVYRDGYIDNGDGTLRVASAAGLKSALANASDGATITLENGTYAGLFQTNKNVTLVAANDRQATIDGLFFNENETTAKLKNLVFTEKHPQVTPNTNTGNVCATLLPYQASLEVENCTFNLNSGYALFAKAIDFNNHIKFQNCTFNCNGNRPIQSKTNITVNGCTFNDQYRFSLQLVGQGVCDESKTTTVVFTNNTIVDPCKSSGQPYACGVAISKNQPFMYVDFTISGNTDNVVYTYEGNQPNLSPANLATCDFGGVTFITEDEAKNQ